MSAKIRRLLDEYDSKWKINKWSSSPSKGSYFVTPIITPIPSEKVRLFFELKWDIFQPLTLAKNLLNDCPIVSCLELRILRESKSGTWHSEMEDFPFNYGPVVSAYEQRYCKPKPPKSPIEMEAYFTIYHPDGRILRECRNPFPINIHKLTNCCFDRTRFEHKTPDKIRRHLELNKPVKEVPFYFTDHCKRLESNNLTLKCHLEFYDYVQPAENVSLKNLQNFTRKLCTMYDQKVLTDIEFKIGGKSLSAHKAVLSAHSPVLSTMVSADFVESKTNIVVITDCSYETFDSFLRFLYSGDIIAPSWQNVLELYLLADKYDVAILREQCADHLIESLNVDRISETWKVANSCRDSRLFKATKKFCATLPDSPD